MIKRKLLFMSLTAITAFGVAFSVVGNKEQGLDYEIALASDYYSGITDEMSGTTLLNALHSLNESKRTKVTGYAGMRYAKFDVDPNGSGKLVGFYNNELIGPSWDGGTTWNREHVWPNVRGGSAVEDDAHMTRPTSTKINSDRGSKGYGMSSYDPGQFVEYYRGAASRIIFYAAIACTDLKLVDNPLNYNGGNPANSMGSLSEMLDWNMQYLPSDTSFTGDNDFARRVEVSRNERIYSGSGAQGNRNPFIDHPEYACRIWGNTNENTRKVCAKYDDVTPEPIKIDVTSVELYIHEMEINVGEEFILNAKILPLDATEKPELFWYSTNNKIASINNNQVRGLKNGTCEIVVSSEDLKFTDRCKVIVGTGKEDEPAKGCGGNITITSIVLSTISLLGIGLILLRKLFVK